MLSKKIEISPIIFTNLLLIATLAQIIACIYLPSFPSISAELGGSASVVQLTLTIFFVSFGISHLIYGPISDYVGRKKPLLFGIALSGLGSIICAFSPTISWLLFGRLLQGIGVGVCGSVGRSIARDLAEGNQLARLGSHLGMISGLMLALAPLLGGYLQAFGGWRLSFIFMGCYIVVMWLLILLFLPETMLNRNTAKVRFIAIWKNYIHLLQNKIFLGYALVSCFSYGSFIAYITDAPFLFQKYMSISPVLFGWLAFFLGSSFFISAFLNNLWIMRQGIKSMTFSGIVIMLIALFLLLVMGLNTFTYYTIFYLFIFTVGAGIVFINSFAGAMNQFPHIAGSAGALFGALQILGGGFSSGLIAFLNSSSISILLILLLLFTAATLGCYHYLINSV